MWSTRARLAAAYSGLLFATLLAFSAAVYVARRASATRELTERGERAAQQVLRTMVDAERSGLRLTVRDSSRQRRSEGTDSVDLITVSPHPDLRKTLEPLPGYFLVLDEQERLLYSSFAVRELPKDDQQNLNQFAVDLTAGLPSQVFLPRATVVGSMLVVGASHQALAPNVSRVVVAIPTAYADVSAQLLLGTMLLLSPLLFIVSVAVAYGIAGDTFKPVDQLINEVEAITDGRSLHRRVPDGEADQELARLADTLNRMIGRLQASFSALRRFTADASHELKTPLTVVRADVERAMDQSAGTDERMEALEEAMQEIARMSDLVDSLLTLARADEGRFDIHRESVRLEPLVRDVFETAVILGEGAGVSVSMPLVEPATVMGDATRLRQLFLNLITNAIKYTPRGGHVEITLSLRNNNEIGFAVRDTGVGIAAADLEHIFDRFWRADRARSRRPIGESRGDVDRGGFGLGLSIAQWIAQAHGGSLTAQSRLARGSIFTVLLPAVSAESGTTAPVERLT